MIQRGGDVVSRMLETGQQVTIKPLIHATLAPGTGVYTEAYGLSNRWGPWGYEHENVGHGRGESARADAGDGFHDVHVNTRDGLWSLWRAWRRPHRGISQANFPLYVGFLEFVHTVRRRGKAVLGTLLDRLLT
jgi:transposase